MEILPKNEFIGDLGEFYFKQYCQRRGYAYIRVERIHETLPRPILKFTLRFWRIPILVPDEAMDELTRVSTPLLVNHSQSFVFDFLTTRIPGADNLDIPNSRRLEDFLWVEVKTGKSWLSRHQLQVSQACKIRFTIARVRRVLSPVRQIEIDWRT